MDRITELKEKIFQLMKDRNCYSRKTCIVEEELLWQLFPEPKYPDDNTPEELAAWRAEIEGWKQQAYGGAGIQYTDTYAGQISSAVISLEKEGRLTIVNCGYNVYVYYLTRANENEN